MSEPTATTHSDGQAGFRFAPGTLLAERYVVERGLGRGGMGEVYQVRDTALGEVVALKMLSPRLASDPVALSRFQGEVRTARQVGHPNVCRTYDFGVHKDERGETAHFLTMELLTGETLAARLSRERLGRAEVLDLLGQVAAAIDAAHAAGIVHRDLKPANVMLVGHSGGGTRAVVTDFGLARQVDESRVTHEGWVGTPAYVAPEQLAGEPGGPAADIYAFGVMLFEAATGRLPFEGSTGPQVALQRMARPAPRARSVDATLPAEWDEAIARCLEKDPAERFTYAGDAVRAMGGEVPGVRPSQAVGDRRSSSRTRMLAGAAMLLLAIGTIAILRARLARGSLPAEGRVLAVRVQRAAGVPEPQLPPELPPFDDAAADVIRGQWTRLEEQRRFRISPDVRGNVEASLDWAPVGAGVRGLVRIQVRGVELARLEAQAPSIRELAIALYPELAARLGEGQSPLELFPEERAEMALWAAPDARAFKDLKRTLVDNYAEYSIDGRPIKQQAQDIARRYPAWSHAVLGELLTDSLTSEDARAVAARYLALPDRAADALGREVFSLIAEGHPERVRAEDHGEELWNRHDLVLDLVVANYALSEGEDEGRAWFVRMAQRYPGLQWAGLSPPSLNGRPDWHFRAPGNRQAWLGVMSALTIGPGDGAGGSLHWFRALQGDVAQALPAVAAIHLARFELDEVRAMAPRLLAAPVSLRTSAMAILAQEAIFRGQLRPAREQHLRAIEAARGAGFRDVNFFWIQSARELLRIDTLIGDQRVADEHRLWLIEDWSRYGWPASALAALRWEAQRTPKMPCPTLPSSAGRSPGSSERDGLRLVHRAAVSAGCGDCQTVLADGRTANEAILPWSSAYARCAVEAGRGLDEALRILRGAERYTSITLSNLPDPSAVDVVLAHYWMGRILEKQGKAAEARAKYDRFLKFWGEADIPIAEVDDAKKRVLALGAGAK